jgi:hypothetical protein
MAPFNHATWFKLTMVCTLLNPSNIEPRKCSIDIVQGQSGALTRFVGVLLYLVTSENEAFVLKPELL